MKFLSLARTLPFKYRHLSQDVIELKTSSMTVVNLKQNPDVQPFWLRQNVLSHKEFLMFLIRRHAKPVNELGRLQRDMNQMLNGVFGNESRLWPALAVRSPVAWPKLDVSETDGAVQVSAELPGLKQDEIDIEVLADTLRISGEKKDERVAEKLNFHSVERTFGRFDRTIPLPAEVDSKNAEATFKDGVLIITLPKLTLVSAQKIAVKSVT